MYFVFFYNYNKFISRLTFYILHFLYFFSLL